MKCSTALLSMQCCSSGCFERSIRNTMTQVTDGRTVQCFGASLGRLRHIREQVLAGRSDQQTVRRGSSFDRTCSQQHRRQARTQQWRRTTDRYPLVNYIFNRPFNDRCETKPQVMNLEQRATFATQLKNNCREAGTRGGSCRCSSVLRRGLDRRGQRDVDLKRGIP